MFFQKTYPKPIQTYPFSGQASQYVVDTTLFDVTATKDSDRTPSVVTKYYFKNTIAVVAKCSEPVSVSRDSREEQAIMKAPGCPPPTRSLFYV